MRRPASAAEPAAAASSSDGEGQVVEITEDDTGTEGGAKDISGQGEAATNVSYLAEYVPHLHTLLQHEQGVDLSVLYKCLDSANKLYGYLIQNKQDEAQVDVLLLYDGFFQPFYREALGPAMRQLWRDERSVQQSDVGICRSVCQSFIQFVAKFLQLHVVALDSRELQPTINQRVGDDLAHLLPLLAELLGANHLVCNRAFNSDAPEAAQGWNPAGLGSWASPQGQQAATGTGSTAEAADVDVTAEPPLTPSDDVAAASWRAAMIDCFGADGGWDLLLQLVSQPQQFGDYLCALMLPLGSAAPLLLPTRSSALLPAAAAVAQFVHCGLAAAPDLSAVEGTAINPEQRLAKVLSLARLMIASATSSEHADEEVGPLQREHVLRLLHATAFTRQLAGIKQMRDLVAFTFYQGGTSVAIEGLTSWLQQHSVVQLVLKSNLHQAQYADQAQHVLGILLQHGVPAAEQAIAFLWQLTEDATTFEAVKSNAYSILASLGPHMEAEQLAQLFSRLQARANASGVSEAISICGLLVSMAQRDTRGSMYQAIVDCMLGIQLRRNAPPELASSQTVVELCASYDAVLRSDKCSLLAARTCMQQLDGVCAVPAGTVLYSLLTTIWHKPDKMRAAMQILNRNAELLKQCLDCYSKWLRRQQAALAAVAEVASSGAPDALSATSGVDGPADGAFSHREAVDTWQRLLKRVIIAGNFYLLQARTALLQLKFVDCQSADRQRQNLHCVRLPVHTLVYSNEDVVCKVQDQIEVMVTWATVERVTAYDSAGFLLDCVCKLSAAYFTLPAWRCFLAYVIALHSWDTELAEEDVSQQHARVTQDNQEAVRTFLWRITLESSDSSIAQLTSHLLATIVATQMHKLLEPPMWHQLLADEVALCLQQLRHQALPAAAAAEVVVVDPDGASAAVPAEPEEEPVLWHAPPLVSLSPSTTAPDLCRRILLYLAQLVEEGQGHKLKEQLSLPDNLPVGRLRRTVADWLAKAPQYVRLLGGGREFDSDCPTLVDSRAAQQLIMAQINIKANHYSGRNVAEEVKARAAVEAVTQQGDIYGLALAIAQSSAAGATPLANNRVLCSLRLLGVLPTCSAALQQLQQLLLAHDGGVQLCQLLLGQAGQGMTVVKPAVFMYAVQCMCALLFPQVEPQADAGAAAAVVEPAVLQRRLLLSGALTALLELATRLAGADALLSQAPAVVMAAAHRAMLLLLHHTHSALQDQRLVAASAVSALQQQQAAAAPQALSSQAAVPPSGPTSMQVDGAPPSSEGAPGADSADGGNRPPSAVPSPAEPASMVADTSTDALDSDGDVELQQAASGATVATVTEVAASATLLGTLAPAVARYAVCMLHRMLGCGADAQPGSRPALAGPAALYELCSQALLLLKQLAPHSSATVLVITAEQSAATEAVVRCMLLHPTSSNLRQLAADWLPGFAATTPTAHRWAFERIVQPLLLNEGGSSGNHEQMSLCNHFIKTLDETEFPAARQLLQVLLQRLSLAITYMAPIDGIAGVVGALIKRLDCREVGLTCNLAGQLIHGCCFPVLTALQQREAVVLSRIVEAAVPQGEGTFAPPQLEPGRLEAADAAAERCVAAARAQFASGISSSNREAAFGLLIDLMMHDSGCWQYGQEQLQLVIHSKANTLLLNPFSNVPLQSVRAPGAFAGLQNGGATCYMSSVFQQLYMQPTIRDLVLSAPAVDPEEQQGSVFHQMQVMFAHLAHGVEPWFEPRDFWRAFKDYDGQPVNIREHQDAYEFFTRLQDSVDEHLRMKLRPRAIHAALGGTFAQLITVIEAPQHRSERDEEFYQISLDVRGKRTLAESLDSYVSKELMNGQNQYLCEQLGKKVDAEKRTLIKQLPHTLVFHLKRFEWDYETYQRWKVKDRFEFPRQLDMYPYTVEGADEADGREPKGKKEASHYLYELRGVVVHSGSAFAGHYYSYIKDRQHGGRWYCFDDTSVDLWDPANLNKDCYGGRFVPEGFTHECDRPNSAYMLFYECAAASTSANQLEANLVTRDLAVPVSETPASEQPAADGVQPMALSPGPAEQASAQAPPATPYNMPRGLYETILVSNLRQLGTMQLLSLEYCNFVWQLLRHLQDAAKAGGTARKAAKREPTSSPGGMDISASGSINIGSGSCQLEALTNRRSGDLSVVVAAVMALCLDYMCQVALRGGLELRREVLGSSGRKPVPGMSIAMVEVLKASPAASEAVLLHMASGPCSSAADKLLTRHPAAAARLFVRHVAVHAVQCLTHAEIRTDEAVHAVRSYVDHLAGDTLPALLQSQTPWHTEQARAACTGIVEALKCMCSQRQPWRRALLDPHLTPLLALVRKVVEDWNSDSFDQDDTCVGHNALCLLGLLLRRFQLDSGLLERSRRKQSKQALQEGGERAGRALRNPYCFDACELAPVPSAVMDWLYGEPQFVRKLLMAGTHWSNPVLFALSVRLAFRSVLCNYHVLVDASDWRDLAVDVETIRKLVTLRDSLYEERVSSFFNFEMYIETSIIKETMNARRGAGCQHLLLALVLAVLVDAPKEIVQEVLQRDISWLGWADKFLDRRRRRELSSEKDDSNPTYADLCAENQA
ncbi:Ubiquitin carboxyl-terminal hydrolase 24 [Chlorella vulgaris]